MNLDLMQASAMRFADPDENPVRGTHPVVIFGFDRVTLWLDRPELPTSQNALAKHCTKINVSLEQMIHHPRWKLKVDVHQPTIDFFHALAKALGNDVAAVVSYVEIACDIHDSMGQFAQRWCRAFLASAYMRYQQQTVVLFEKLFYFGRRAGRKAGRRGNVLAVYADKPSKINNARPAEDAPPCLHIEWRATGSATVELLGIFSIADLIRFDHERFWNEHIRMYQLPKPTELGRLLAGASGQEINVSGSALRKRATKWRANQQHNIDDIFVMHNALLNTRKINSHLKKVSFTDWLKATLMS